MKSVVYASVTIDISAFQAVTRLICIFVGLMESEHDTATVSRRAAQWSRRSAVVCAKHISDEVCESKDEAEKWWNK